MIKSQQIYPVPKPSDSVSLIKGAPVSVKATSLWSWLSHYFYETPNNTALVVTQQNCNHLSELKANPSEPSRTSHLEWTYGDLENASLRLSAALHQEKIRADDVFATFVRNGVEFAIAELTAVRLNATLAPLDPKMIERPKELEYHLQLLKPRIVLVEDEKVASRIGPYLSKQTVKLFGHGPSKEGSWASMSSFALEKKLLSIPPSEASLDSTAHIVFTSGTTGTRPKGCLRSQKSVMVTCQNAVSERNVRYGKRYLVPVVNFRATLPTNALVAWYGGSTLVFCSHGFDAGAMIDALINHGVTNLITGAVALYALARHPSCPETFPKSLVHVALVGDIVTEDIRQRGKDLFGDHVSILSSFGQTEVPGAIGYGTYDRLDDGRVPSADSGILAVGRVFPGWVVKVAALHSNRPLKVGMTGELHYSGAYLLPSYLDNGYSNCFYDDQDGHWYKSGDLGAMREDGYIYVLGRIKDIIKHHGISISPSALEAVLNTEREIQVRVIGLPDQEAVETPVAIVKCPPSRRSGLAEMLLQRATRALGEEKTIRAVYFTDDLGIDAFPTNHMGKTVRAELRQAVVQKLLAREDSDEDLKPLQIEVKASKKSTFWAHVRRIREAVSRWICCYASWLDHGWSLAPLELTVNSYSP